MTAWLLLVTAGVNALTVSGIATQADCDTLATSLQQAIDVSRIPSFTHSCISYEAATTISEVHVFGSNTPKPPGEAPSFQFKPKPKAR